MEKTFLLLEPENLTKAVNPFFILEKDPSRKAQFEISDFNYEYFRIEHINEINSDTVSIYKGFETKQIKSQIKLLEEQYKKLRLSISIDDFLRKNLKKYYYDLYFKIFDKQAFPSKLYQRIPKENARYLVSACSFSSISPKLSFKVQLIKNQPKLFTYFTIENSKTELSKLKIYEFLMDKENVFYIINKKDYSTLQYLNKTAVLIKNEQDFIDKIYKYLQKSYEIDAAGLFQEMTVEIAPKVEIQVTEVSGEFLMFIPRFNYDGNVVEGEAEQFQIIEGFKKVTYIRNKKFEADAIKQLKEAHPNFKNKNSLYLKFSEASKKNWFYNFYHNTLKENFTVVGMDMLSYFRYSDYKMETSFKIIKTIGNEIVAEVKVKFGKEKVSLKALQKAVIEERKFVFLKDNSLGALTEEWVDQYAMILKFGQIDGDEITFAKWILIVSEKLVNQQKNLKLLLPDNWLDKWEKWNQTDEKLYEVPKSVNATLRPYQQKGYEWLNLMAEVNAGTLLADDMGLGKTLQTISSIAHLLEENPNAKIVIITPASLIFNWKEEFKKFTPHLKTFIYHGSGRKFEDYVVEGANIIITSYSTVRNDTEYFNSIIWDMSVLDESHNIKNLNALQTQAVLSLVAKRRIILNGTPIMNNVFDLYPQFNFILPQIFHSPKKFREEFEKPISKNMAEDSMQQLKKLTNPFILRRTKELAAPDLPSKTESVMWCEMQPEQREAYETIKKQVKSNVLVEVKDKGVNKAKLNVLQGINKLRQVCSSPRLIKSEPNFAGISSVKIDNLIESITTNLKDNKVIVFSQFLETIKILSEGFEKNNIKYVAFDGSTPSEKRMELVSEFQSPDSDIQVFLLSLMAGNSGINLTAANYVYLVEPWWNKAVQQQAIDRVHRIGQSQKVFAYNMICKDTIEEKILALQNKKQFISDEVIGNDEGFVKSLTQEDIEFLFE